jgi:signal transduction histidine kinase
MTIKKQWMLALILSAVLSVIINTFVLSSLINNYFVDAETANYEHHYGQILEFTQKALSANYSKQQLAVQLETHLIDPIREIRLYDVNGNLLADVINRPGMMNGKGYGNGMMGSRMMDRMMGRAQQEVDSAELSDNGAVLGRLDVVRYSSIGNSLQTRMFTFALIRNSIFSFAIALALMLVIGSLISRRMSRDLRNTAAMATNIDLGNETNIERSKVREIRIIQQSLDTLQSKLKLKQISRKRLLDELVHQTRTPLTILKTHLEGFEDGVLTMTPEEIKTCESQIDSITAIIANMSEMIDAEKSLDAVQTEDVEIGQLLRQIIGALKMQFGKKQIELALTSHKKINIRTDRYKLSQCIYNILTNAYKFTGPGGKVTVSYESQEKGLRIVIEDTGSGISAEDRERLFDAYFRGENSSGVSGEGIGLYVVKENMDRISGRIDVESEIGKGSRFILTIPSGK